MFEPINPRTIKECDERIRKLHHKLPFLHEGEEILWDISEICREIDWINIERDNILKSEEQRGRTQNTW